MNFSCNVNVSTPKDLYILNHPCNFSRFNHAIAKYPTSTYSYSVLAAACVIFALIIIFWFNSVRVIKHKLYVPILSNTIWIVYFIFAGLKSIVLAVTYARKYEAHDGGYHLANWILGTLELSLFCLALSYQEKFRCGGGELIPVDLENKTSFIRKFYEKLNAADYFLSLATFITIISIILFASLTHYAMIFFWIYVSLTGLLILTCLGFAVVIAHKKGFRKPPFITKVCFIFGVLFTAPERIPIFIWQYCVYENKYHCWGRYYDLFDLFLLFKLVSIFLVFCALVKEFNRLKERAQFSILREVQGGGDFNEPAADT